MPSPQPLELLLPNNETFTGTKQFNTDDRFQVRPPIVIITGTQRSMGMQQFKMIPSGLVDEASAGQLALPGLEPWLGYEPHGPLILRMPMAAWSTTLDGLRFSVSLPWLLDSKVWAWILSESVDRNMNAGALSYDRLDE